jgi:tetratricopeptide (TPR) repeat protein
MDFTESQKKFAAFHLFVNTFREAPAFIGLSQNLYDRCFTFMENKSNGEYFKEILTSNKEQIFDWFVNVPFLSVIINSFLQEQFPQNLLDIQQVLIAIDQHFSELTPTTSSPTVYRVQFLREEDLQIIKTNIHELITFHTYIVATKDLLTARMIARQAADRGLLIVILQIEIPAQAYILELDNNRLMFQFDTIFRIRSINLAPDTVWYAQLNYADLDFQPIQEGLQLQLGEQPTWLTLGNYLYALNHFDEAKFYYQYLSNALPENHPALPSIYNNMGLIYAESGDHEESLKCYNTAIGLLDKVSPNTDYTFERTLSQSAETGMTVDNCPLHHTMDEVHSQQSQWEEALECYRKALELATDPLTRLQYEQKIKDILSSK